MTDLLDLIDQSVKAEQSRKAAVTRVVKHADENKPGWSDRAFEWIVLYAKTHETFISEECTAAATAAGVPQPHDKRAWGGPFQRAANAGVIRRDGYGISNNRNRSPTPLWRAVREQGAS